MSESGVLLTRQHGLPVRTDFGASGRMRERIENGNAVDVFTSDDIGHARKLDQEGRASITAMFAQNALCLLAPWRLGLVARDAAVDTLLRPDLRIGVSPPRIDPLGDYTVQLFEKAQGDRPDNRATPAERPR